MIIILRFNYLKKKLTINNNVMYLKKLLSIFLNVLLFDSNIGYTSIPIQNNLCDYCGPNTLRKNVLLIIVELIIRLNHLH